MPSNGYRGVSESYCHLPTLTYTNDIQRMIYWYQRNSEHVYTYTHVHIYMYINKTQIIRQPLLITAGRVLDSFPYGLTD